MLRFDPPRAAGQGSARRCDHRRGTDNEAGGGATAPRALWLVEEVRKELENIEKDMKQAKARQNEFLQGLGLKQLP